MEWKVCKEPYQDYEISEYGDMRNKYSKETVKTHKLPDGYLAANIQISCAKIHRLVALNFVDNPNPFVNTIVNHIDENKLNNHYSNLEWVTYEQNKKYGKGFEKMLRNFSKKRRIYQYDKLGNVVNVFNSCREAERLSKGQFKDYGISRCCNHIYQQHKGFIFRYEDDI